MERKGFDGLILELVETYLLVKARGEEDPARFAAIVETGALTRAAAYMLGYTYSGGFDDDAKSWRTVCRGIRAYVETGCLGYDDGNATRDDTQRIAAQVAANVRETLNIPGITV